MGNFSKYDNPIIFKDFEKAFTVLKKNQCHEVLFAVAGYENYQHCWMGYEASCFWFGLTEDGNSAYEFETFEEFIAAPVFDGKNLIELWSKIQIKSFDALDPQHIFNA